MESMFLRKRKLTRNRVNIEEGGNSDAKIYVGKINADITKRDLQKTFSYYGPIRSAWVAHNPPGFGFVEFYNAADAEEAIKDTDNKGFSKKTICGHKVHIRFVNRCCPNRRSGYPFDDRCFKCHKSGHYARDCLESSQIGCFTRNPYLRSHSRSPTSTSDHSRLPMQFKSHRKSRSSPFGNYSHSPSKKPFRSRLSSHSHDR